MNTGEPNQPVPGRVDRLAEWRSRLALWSIGATSFLALSGLLIWLLPFSQFVQVTVLGHTLIGLAFLVPILAYCIRHWWVYRQNVLTHVKLLGYLSAVVLAVCVTSGVALTYQPLFKTRISYSWRALHEWTTVALLAFVLPHILFILVRDARARLTETVAPVWATTKRFGW